MTYRERRLARADRLRTWSDRREESGRARIARGDQYRGDIAFATQPGRIPERDRINAAERRGFEDLEAAERMRARADAIERQADRAIYSDDPDAAERLRERIAELEAERAAIRAYNADCRRAAKTGGVGNVELLPARLRREPEQLLRAVPYQVGPGRSLPSYVGGNIGGNIGRLRERLALIERKAAKHHG